MNGAAVIDVKGLTKIFGGRRVVDDVSMRVERGRICGFLGPNGSGKTTTIRMLCGLLKPDAGSGTCLGYDILREAARDQAPGRLHDAALQLLRGPDRSARTSTSSRASTAFADRTPRGATRRSSSSGSPTARDQLAGQLSGGWKQRLALAACMLHEPQLLLLDEPTAGVDPKARRDFWDQIHELAAAGITVLVSTHYMDEAERCHELAYIAYGKLLVTGTASEVVAHSRLVTWTVDGRRARASWRRSCATRPGVAMVAAFGNALHVSGDGCRARSRRRRRRVPRAARARVATRRAGPRGRVHPPDG